MHITAAMHGVEKIEIDKPRIFVEGSTTQTVTLRITDRNGHEFELDLFGPTADSLTMKLMED